MHLVLECIGLKDGGVAKTLCGQTAILDKDSSSINFESITTVNEILRAATRDENNKICIVCLAEFFDKVLPVKWKLMTNKVKVAKGQ